MSALARALLTLSASFAVACGEVSPSLGPAQTFNFAAQAIAFAPPPSPWQSEAQSSGGLRGVRFVKIGGEGEAIGVANYYDVSMRLRRVELAKLVANDTDFQRFEFEQALNGAWAYLDNPYTPLETEVATGINEALARANYARETGDYVTLRSELLAAQAEAERLHFSFSEVIGRALFRPEKTQDASRYEFVARREARAGGEPAVVIDYIVKLREGNRYMRKVYVFHNDHLFVADFIGLKKTLPLFDKVVASIAFPR